MLRYVLFDTTLFGGGENKEQAEKDICWMMEALVQRNMNYLREHPSTPRLYRSGVTWSAPKQLTGDVDEVAILKKVLGSNAYRGDVNRALITIQDVLGGERFRDIGRVIENGDGDCDNLNCWRVAELRQQGIQARPFMTSRERPDGTTYHALVIWPPLGPCNYETSEDPSLLLGMYQPSRKADRDEEIRKNQERSDILRKYGRAALRPMTQNALTSYDGIALDAAVAELFGRAA